MKAWHDPSAKTGIVLPAHWRPWQRRKNTLIFFFIRIAAAITLSMPRFVARALGASGMWLGYWLAVSDRKRAIAQLKEAMPEIQNPERTIRQMFVHFGLAAADWVSIHRLTTPGNPNLDFPEAGHQVLRDAHARGKGVLIVSPHLGNFELYGQAVTRAGYPAVTIAKETYDPRITKLLTDFRFRGGVNCIWRGDPDKMKKIRQVFTDGNMLGVLIDQDTKVPSVFVPFFGRLASTPVVPSAIARKADASVVFGYAVRDGWNYRMHFEHVNYPRTDDEQQDAWALTAELTRLTEQAVRKYPSQWVWMHRRWKTRPQS